MSFPSIMLSVEFQLIHQIRGINYEIETTSLYGPMKFHAYIQREPALSKSL